MTTHSVISAEFQTLFFYRRLQLLAKRVLQPDVYLLLLQDFDDSRRRTLFFCFEASSVGLNVVRGSLMRVCPLDSSFVSLVFVTHKISSDGRKHFLQAEKRQNGVGGGGGGQHRGNVFCKFEMLSWQQIIHNPLDNVNVPHYQILSEEEIQYLEKRKGFGFARRNLPKIQLNQDPIACFLGLKLDTVLWSKEGPRVVVVSGRFSPFSKKKK